MAASTNVADVQAFIEYANPPLGILSPAHTTRPGTLPQLIDRLTGQDAAPHLSNYLLITFKDFSTADELLAALRRRFESVTNLDDPQHRNVRLRVVNILKLWVTNHYNDLALDEAALAGVKDLLTFISKSAGTEKAAEAVLAAIARKAEDHALRRQSVAVSPPDSSDASKGNVRASTQF